MRRRAGDQALVTVLFTDIVGSTRIASELGDRRWRVLLSRHHRIVREELRRFAGREVDTAGDGFYAVFDEPSRAVRCACAVSDRVRELGIEIRAGLNIGETEAIGGKPGGVAVHAASRIMSLAGPAEVLVSSMVRDLMPGSGFTFEDRGAHELRDVAGTWQLSAVTAVDGARRKALLSAEEAANRRAEIEPPPLLQRRSGRIGAVAVGAVIAVVAALVVAPLATRGSPAGSASPGPTATRPGDRLVRIDAAKGKVVAAYDVGDHPTAVAFGEGSVWVANANDRTVTRVDPATGRTDTIHVPAIPNAIAAGAGAVWVGQGNAGVVSRIDPVLLTTETIDLGVGAGDHSLSIAVDDATDSVWVSTSTASFGGVPFKIGRIDPDTKTFSVVKTVIGDTFATLAAGSGSVWFASSEGSILRLDPRSGRTIWRGNLGKNYLASTVGNGSVWLGSALGRPGRDPVPAAGGAIRSIALATNSAGDTVSIGGATTGIAVLGQGVYASDILGFVHPYIASVVGNAIPVGGEATGIAAGQGFLWVSVNER